VRPQARQDHLTIRVLPDETLIYDGQRHKAHCLNAPAALVWRHCNGKNFVDDLVRLANEELGIVDSTEIVGLALEQLSRRGLLDDTTGVLPTEQRILRREALKRLAIAAVTLPLVMTITTRTAAQTISDPSSGSTAPDNTAAPSPVTVVPSFQVTVQQGSGSGSGSGLNSGSPLRKGTSSQTSTACRTKGQSCLAATASQQGTCCAGLTCLGVAQGAGVCG
jgi:hypothetical protein